MRRALAVVMVLAVAAPAGAQDLELPGFEHAPAAIGASLRSAMYEQVELLGESKVWSPRTAEERRRRLELLARRRPASAEVQRWLARALADVGDYRAAEAAYRRAETLASDETWPLEALADYAASRGNWTGQLGALKRLVARREKRLALPGQRDVLARELREIATLIESHQLAEDPLRYRRQAAELFPERYGAGSEVIRWLVDQGRLEAALEQFEWARRLRPEDRHELARFEVELLFRLDRPARAREVLRRESLADDGLQPAPGWDEAVRALRVRGELEAELRRVRTVLRGDVAPSVELAEAVHLLRAAGYSGEARAALERAQAHAEDASEEDLLLLAALQLHLDRPEDASRLLARVAATSRGAARDEAQARLALLLAENRGDVRPSGLQALLDPSRLDPGPSVVGGALSLLLGGPPGSAVARELRERDERHLRAARSAALLDDLIRRRPSWARLPRLERRLIEAYRAFGAYRTALATARRFLERHPDHPDFFIVGLEAAILARLAGQPAAPLLRQLAQRAVIRGDDAAHRRVLRALEQELVREGRTSEVLTAYLAAIDERPDDVQLYDALLGFLGRHNLYDEEEQVYQRAMARFQDATWASGYARWLLRHRGVASRRALSRRLVAELPPTALSTYLERVVTVGSGRGPDGEEADAFFVEIHREALRRHPGELRLVRRLVNFFESRRGRDPAAVRALLVRYAAYDEQLRGQLFRELAAAGELEGALAELAGRESAVARVLAADFLIRRAEQRRARGALEALVAAAPTHRAAALRLAALESSLGETGRARERLAALLGRWPADADLLTRAGELAMEDADLDAARRYWGRIHEAASGDRRAYLRAATLFWDYFLFDDAARTLLAARDAVSEQNLFAAQLAAVHESAGNKEPAIREYVRVLADAARSADTWPPIALRATPPPSSRSGASGDDEGEDFDDSEGYGDSSDDRLASTGGLDESLVPCARRLLELASRAGDREIVEAVLRDVLSASPEDAGLVHVRVDVLEGTGRWDEAYRLLADAARRITAPSLRERAISELSAAGHEDEATTILQRLAQDRPLDVIPTFRFVDHLERIGHIRTAARVLSAMSERLADDESRRSDRETIEARLARLLYAHRRLDEAVAAGERAIALAQAGRARRLRIEVARWLLRAEHAEDAVAMIEPVLAERPDDSAALDVYAGAMTILGREGGQHRQEVVQALIGAFDAAIAASRAGGRGDGAAREATVRRTLIRHLTALGAHRAVLDQNVALLNADLENLELLRRAARHAAAHGLFENLEARYRRDAERSPRDHRLPLVLARLAASRRAFDEAADQMRRSLRVAPERMDLREELIGYVLRQVAESQSEGGWREAAAQYHELAELEQANGDTGSRWVAAEARMLGRAGDWEAMDEALERLVALDNGAPGLRLVAARELARAGRWREAWAQSRRSLESWRDADDDALRRTASSTSRVQLEPCVEAAVRAGRWREVDGILRGLEDAWLEASQEPNVRDRYALQRLSRLARDARVESLPRALRTWGVDGDVLAYVEALREEMANAAPLDNGRAPVSVYAAIARRAAVAGAPRRQIELLAEVAEPLRASDRAALTREMTRALWRMGAARDVASIVSDEASLPPRDRLREQLRAAAALGDREVEQRSLLSLLETESGQRFDARNPLLEQLLMLLWTGDEDDRESIPLLARPGVDASGQVVNFLLQQGDSAGASAALERYGEGARDTRWMDVARALVQLHRARRGPAPDDPGPFARVLDLRSIGEQVARAPDRRSTLGGRAWVELARPYGEALARQASAGGEPQEHAALRLEHAGIEQEPRDADAQVRLAREALARSEPDLAIEHYRLARQLSPDSATIRDGLARSMLAAGRRDDALELWDAVLEDCETERCFAGVTHSMAQAGLVDEAVTRAMAHLRDAWRGGALSLALVRQMARDQGARARERGGPVDRFVWDLWQLDRGRDDLLRAAAGLDRGRGLLEGRARGRYLRQGLRMHGPESTQRLRWVQAYVDYLVGYDEHLALVELLERYTLEREAVGQEVPLTLRLAHARGLVGLGRREEALDVLRDVAAQQPQAAVRLLRELELDREAWELQLEVADRRLEEGDERRATALAAVEALLELGRGDEAVEVARRAAVTRADDAATLRALATILAEHERPAEAMRLRRLLYVIDRGDADNLLAMARLEMTLGRLDRARQRALSLLARWAVPAQVEEGAVELLVELALADRAQERRIISALTEALDGAALDEDRALALARVQYESGNHAVARLVLERAIREAAAPWRSLQLLAAWEVEDGALSEAERALETAVVHADGAMEVRRQLFLVRRRLGHHQAALAAVGVSADRPAGTTMLRGLEDDEAIAFAAEIADSAAQNQWWAAADAYSSEALRRIDADEDPDRARIERARLHVIRSHLDRRRAAARGRPWIRRAR